MAAGSIGRFATRPSGSHVAKLHVAPGSRAGAISNGRPYRDLIDPVFKRLEDPDGNGFSVAFIPGRLSDHNLLDDKYVYCLRMMSGSLSPAMEQGCWCELQGAYLANWNSSKMVIPYAKVDALVGLTA